MNDNTTHAHHAAADDETVTKTRKSAMISVRLSDDELKSVQARAEAHGKSVSAYLRNLATHGDSDTIPTIARAAHASSSKPKKPIVAVFTGYGDNRVMTA